MFPQVQRREFRKKSLPFLQILPVTSPVVKWTLTMLEKQRGLNPFICSFIRSFIHSFLHSFIINTPLPSRPQHCRKILQEGIRHSLQGLSPIDYMHVSLFLQNKNPPWLTYFLASLDDWFTDPMDTQIWGFSSPLYEMEQYLYITYVSPSVYPRSSLDYLYLIDIMETIVLLYCSGNYNKKKVCACSA